MLIRDARPDEAEALLALQRRASDVWEEHREQLATHPDAIELPEHARIRVAIDEEKGGRLLGFAALLEDGELDGLFVEPDAMRGGIGRALVADAAEHVRADGASRIEVTANPRALGFYERVGFVRGGTTQTRFGPAIRMSLTL